ncbi:hypothetical protein PIB30_074524 [Stylosanthes scabra]|uniref:Uncharacterized protein n=1 Tax=Stylosanthes scabra TaxID=79078 RepID=A0ABU6TPC0_9FABA|nr:hypothetical protein [Stylosanthes scabra]
MAPCAGAPLRTIARYPGGHSSGFCPHRVAARFTHPTARSKVNSSVNTDRAPARSPLCNRTEFRTCRESGRGVSVQEGEETYLAM